jgi:glycosyltransferase domain-containing protein
MEHTIVIPTFNRPAAVRRLVAYFAKSPWPFEVLVLDSSDPAIALSNKHDLALIHPYLVHQIFDSSTPMASKLAEGLKFVATPTVSLCADDDFVLPAMAKAASEFIIKSPEYVCAHGLYVNFTIDGSLITLTKEYCSPSIEDANGAERVFSLMQAYESLFYAVYRTEDFKKIFHGVCRQETLHFQEMFQSVASLFLGKTKRFPSIYAARQSCAPAEPERNKWQTYYWFADDTDDFVGQYGRYRHDLCDFVSVNRCCPNLTDEKCRKVLDLSHAIYFSAGCPPMYFRDRLNDCISGAAFRLRMRDCILCGNIGMRSAKNQDMFMHLHGRFSQAARRVADSFVALPFRTRSLFGRLMGKVSRCSTFVSASCSNTKSSGNIHFCLSPELQPLSRSMELRNLFGEMMVYLSSSPSK